MKRKLASVQTISDIQPIEGADRIEVVSVLGWKCVAKKGEFHTGDLCVYFEVDSFLPVCEKFEFLRNSCYKNNDLMGEGFLLRTQKFRGQISQGLALPLTILPTDAEQCASQIGDDVTEILGVHKWSTPEVATGSGTAIGPMPYSIPKTDEIRVQAEPGLIEEFKGVPYYISTKMDGTSVTMYLIDGKFGVCGRNFEYADNEKCPFWKFAHKNEIREKIEAGAATIGLKNFAIQGEILRSVWPQPRSHRRNRRATPLHHRCRIHRTRSWQIRKRTPQRRHRHPPARTRLQPHHRRPSLDEGDKQRFFAHVNKFFRVISWQ